MGLGNPGERYSGTRHNLGYRVVELLFRSSRAERPFHLRHSCCAAAEYGSQRLLLVQPRTFMNLSGRAAAELMQRFSFSPEQLILIYDDLDLPPGWIRLRSGGGSGGHRGVRSVIETLGTGNFLRLRIGIGKPLIGDTATYVLAEPPLPERELLEGAVERAVEALFVYLGLGLDEAMNRFNRPP